MNKKILIVDDDPNILELLEVNLCSAGYDVYKATDGREGLCSVEENEPHAIVLDVMMPHVDGWELCKVLRDDPFFRDIKIILLTARDSERDKMIGKNILEANEYMTKPFEVDELLKVLERLLNE